MKIYRIAQEVFEVDEMPDESKPQYMDIGHNNFYEYKVDESNDVIWGLTQGQILTKVVGPEEDHSIFGKKGMSPRWMGRYDTATESLSIKKPFEQRFRDVPNSVMKMLYDKFPNVKKVYIFQ